MATQQKAGTNVLAIVSLIAGVLSLCMGWSLLVPIAAIITGFLARKQIAETGEEGMMFANIGLGLGIALVAIYLLAGLCYFIFFGLTLFA